MLSSSNWVSESNWKKGSNWISELLLEPIRVQSLSVDSQQNYQISIAIDINEFARLLPPSRRQLNVWLYKTSQNAIEAQSRTKNDNTEIEFSLHG